LDAENGDEKGETPAENDEDGRQKLTLQILKQWSIKLKVRQ
jgi:hypothetical protein